jgi:hypothetical protein
MWWPRKPQPPTTRQDPRDDFEGEDMFYFSFKVAEVSDNWMFLTTTLSGLTSTSKADNKEEGKPQNRR